MLTLKFDAYQSIDQADLDMNFSMVDYLQEMKFLIDTVEIRAVRRNLDCARIDSRYSQLMKNIYLIYRSVRKEDTLLQKLLTLALEDEGICR